MRLVRGQWCVRGVSSAVRISVQPDITAMASAIEGFNGSSCGVRGISCVRRRALEAGSSVMPAFSDMVVAQRFATVVQFVRVTPLVALGNVRE